MRHRNEELNVTGNEDYRVNVLATSILGFLWNNHITFREKFPKKKPGAPADKIPVFMEDVVEEVKKVILDRARIVRSNYNRSIGSFANDPILQETLSSQIE